MGKNKKTKNHYDNEKLFNRFGFRTIYNHPDMGLNNTLCDDKYAICKYKQVYLTKEQCQKCLNKMDLMMIEKRICYYLKINII